MSVDPQRAVDERGTETKIDPTNIKAHSGLRTGVGFLFWAEALLLTLTFAALGAGAVPGVNESHYWTKAKSFWDPSYCPADLFLQSSDAHLVFYWTLGWLVVPFSLPTAVWVARWIIWLTTAAGWTYLSRSVNRSFGVAILSGGLMIVLNRWFHLAGEWVIGGAEAKGLAFACVFVAIGCACQRRWLSTWVWGGAAAAFHVLVGGWMVLSLMLAAAVDLAKRWQVTRGNGSRGGDRQQNRSVGPTIRRHLIGMLIGGGLSLFGLVPALTLNWNVPSEVSNAGAEIYATQRIAHHLAIWAFSPYRLLAFVFLLLIWLVLSNWRWKQNQIARELTNQHCWFRDWPFTCLWWTSVGSLAIALGGAVLGVLVLESDLTWKSGIQLLRYYWFRCSDVAIPVYVSLAIFTVAKQRQFFKAGQGDAKEAVGSHREKVGLVACLLATTLIVTEMVSVWREIQADPRPVADKMSLPGSMEGKRASEYYKNWVKVCQWVRDNTDSDSMFLTPRSQQTFKWYAGRPEVICWKDVPQDSASLLEWRQRAADCFPHTDSEWGFAINQPEVLQQVIEKYDVDYLLIPQSAYELKDRFGRQLPYEMVYPESVADRSTFVVLKTSDSP